MDKIIKVLKENNLTESMLPTSIQEKIDLLEKLIIKHNNEVDELEESENVTDEQEQHIEQQSNMIDSQEELIYNEIVAFLDEKQKEEEKRKSEEKEKKAKSDAEKLAKEEAEKNKQPEPKKKSGLGMFILGAVVLIATAGVVNVMNKK